MALKKASEEVGVGFDVGATGSDSDSLICVNQQGRRFMDEGQSLDHFKGTRPWLDTAASRPAATPAGPTFRAT